MRTERLLPATLKKALLSRPEPELCAELAKVSAITAGAFAIPTSHQRDLPLAVRDLSRILTEERGQLSRPYWSSPRYVFAYLHYFLPWNLYRMAWLLPNLEISLKPGDMVLDLGSGPLTLPLALWCARPDLRSLPLTFVCSDLSARIMEAGRSIFREIAGPDCAWRIKLLRAPVAKALAVSRSGPYALIMAGNLLNELAAARHTASNHDLAAILARLMAEVHARLAPNGSLLLVEPGTRLGGKLISLGREAALRHSFIPLAPCPHCNACPMPGLREAPDRRTHMKANEAAVSGRVSPYSGWCHFTFPALDVPPSLAELGKQARLKKERLAISCLLLKKQDSRNTSKACRAAGLAAPPFLSAVRTDFPESLDELEALYAEIMGQDLAERTPDMPFAVQGEEKELSFAESESPASKTREKTAKGSLSGDVRIISSPVQLPDAHTSGRYACCEKGLALLLDAETEVSGALVPVRWPLREQRDRKTNALLLYRNHPPTKDKTGELRNKKGRNQEKKPGRIPRDAVQQSFADDTAKRSLRDARRKKATEQKGSEKRTTKMVEKTPSKKSDEKAGKKKAPGEHPV